MKDNETTRQGAPPAADTVRSPTLLVISQVYIPDPASVGQYMADAAVEMARRGWRVVVLTANRGYDDPSMKYKPREVIEGVEVIRLPLSSFGKKSIATRLIAGMFFVTQCILRGLFRGRLSAILVSTSPPMAPVAALTLRFLRRAPIKFWVMDLNLDQMIALGGIKATSLPARLFGWMNRRIFRRASDVIALDRFMADRIRNRYGDHGNITILPPWPHDDHLEDVAHPDNPFRKKHGLDGRFVFMYSGNMGIGHPIAPLLEAALRMQDDDRSRFLFIGGGVRKKEVEETICAKDPHNIASLPYQPLSELKYSLSAADVHFVSMDETGVGYFHPSKVYGALAVGRPILLLGPDPCHVTDLLDEHNIGWRVAEDDAEGLEQTLRRISKMDRQELEAMGQRARETVKRHLSKDLLCHRFCDVLEAGTRARASSRVPASPI